MKILQIINSLATGGAEKLILDTVPLYNAKGLEMDVLVLNGTQQPFLEKLKQLECCSVFSLGNLSVYNPILIFKIIPYLRKYDVVHVHLFPALYWVALAKVLSFAKVKLVFTEHNTNNRRMNSKIFRVFDKIAYSFYKAVICITTEVQTVLLEHLKQTKSKFPIINNGVDLNAIQKAQAYEKEFIEKKYVASDVLLIQVAGFREQKDQPTLIKALKHLPANVKLLLVGEGVLRKECEALVAQLNVEERVTFLGLRMDIPALLKTADFIILSSKYEGLSLSSIEGMATGKPFLASNVPGLSDVVQGAGVLFEQGNAKELAELILKLHTDQAAYQAVATACSLRASQFDIQIMVDKHIALYESIG